MHVVGACEVPRPCVCLRDLRSPCTVLLSLPYVILHPLLVSPDTRRRVGPEDGKLLVPLVLGLQLVGVGTTATSAALANGRSRAASRNRAFLVLITAGQVALFAALEFLMGRCGWVWVWVM